MMCMDAHKHSYTYIHSQTYTLKTKLINTRNLKISCAWKENLTKIYFYRYCELCNHKFMFKPGKSLFLANVCNFCTREDLSNKFFRTVVGRLIY